MLTGLGGEMMQETTCRNTTSSGGSDSGKKTPQFYWGLACKVSNTKTFHPSGKSHLVIPLSLEVCICGSSQDTWEPLQASYFCFVLFIHTIAHSSGVCCTRSYWRSTAQLWTITPKERERLANVPVWAKLLQKHLSSPQWLYTTISRKILPSHIQAA